MQHDGGRGARRVGRAGDGDAAVGLLQRGSVVHAVAGHADDVAALLQDVDDVELVLGEHLGEAVGLLDGLGHRRASLRAWRRRGRRRRGCRCPSRASWRSPWRWPAASPVTILTFTPICRAVAMVALASSRGGSNSGSTPRNCQSPSPSARATPSERKPRAANSLTALSTAAFTCRGIGRQRQDHLRRALGHLERLAVRGLDGGLGALVHRVERLEMRPPDSPSAPARP